MADGERPACARGRRLSNALAEAHRRDGLGLFQVLSGSLAPRSVRGEDLVLADPAIVGASEAAFAFPPAQRWMIRAAAQQVIRLHPAGDPVA